MQEIERLLRRSLIHQRPAAYEGLWTLQDQAPNAEPEQIFSLRCHTEQAADRSPLQTFFSANDAPHPLDTLWWSRTGSNRRPPACKAGALPAELRPHLRQEVVGLGGLEPPTSRLSSARSNQLSYKPSTEPRWHQKAPARHAWKARPRRSASHHSRRKRNEGGRAAQVCAT